MLTPSDSVLAAIIAGTATLSASFLQLRSAALREARQSGSRRKSRLQRLVFFAIIGGSAVSGFAVSQWLTAGERAAQGALAKELQARIAEVSSTAGELEATHAAERAEIEGGVLRRIGSDGVAVVATVPACRIAADPPAAAVPATLPAAAPAAVPAAAPGRACSEAEAVPVTLCATIPAGATVTEVGLFSRPADSDTPWSASRFLPGQEAGDARFAEKYSESPPESGTREVCQAFAHWSADHARVVRMLVRYSL
ncbi:MAG TPA: hypothetical protein VGR80_02680 [Steroidobacteraceae bacterium]|nr:hypothetical protein [Gammaproteobacteria bacterium]HEV2284923.1 hypothetical protein [Steroidobacteraceae bacterium]